mgnify:CR=1 FL=1
MDYSYPHFYLARNPRRPVSEAEYVYLKRNLNHFMHKMLEQLYSDPKVLGEAQSFKTGHFIAFLVLAAASVAGILLLEHPGFVALSGFIGIVMGMSVIAAPVNFSLDKSRYKRHQHRFAQETKSYYMYQHSILHKTDGYDDYLSQVGDAPLDWYERYLKKYL